MNDKETLEVLNKINKSIKDTTKEINNLNSSLNKTFQNMSKAFDIKKPKELISTLSDIEGAANALKNIRISVNDKDISKITKSLAGFVGLTSSIDLMTDSFHRMSNEGSNLGNSLQLVAGGIGAIAGGAIAGSSFGLIGTAIGALTGIVSVATSAIKEYQSETDKMIKNAKMSSDEIQNCIDKINESKQKLERGLASDISITKHHENLLIEMNDLVDANSKVKNGYEDRVEFILNELNEAYNTEYKLIDGIITQNGKQVKSYEEVEKSMRNLIMEKQVEIILNAYEQEYALALKRNLTNFSKKEQALRNLEIAQNAVNEKEKEWDKIIASTPVNLLSVALLNHNTELQKLKESLKFAQEAYDGATKLYEDDSRLIIGYEQLKTDALIGEYDRIEERIIELTNVYTKENNGQVENVKATTSELLKYYKEQGNLTIQTVQENGGKINKEVETQAYANYNTVLRSLVEQSQIVDNLSEDIVNSWKFLAESSTLEFVNEFNNLPQEVQNELLPKLKLTGLTLSGVLSSGIKFDGTNIFNGWNTTITKLYDTVGTFIGKIGVKLPPITSLKIFAPAYANGGMPEDGMFLANHNELVGKFSNGRTAVANNEMIVEGIKVGVYEAVAMAISQFSRQSNEIDVHVHTDEGTVIDGIEQRIKQTGQLPFVIPMH